VPLVAVVLVSVAVLVAVSLVTVAEVWDTVVVMLLVVV
jgi:hypothetical protein